MKRVEVSVVATHISPAIGYGGVAESIYNLVRCWAGEGHRLSLCVSDASLGPRLTAQMIALPTNVEVNLYRGMFFKRWGFGFGAIWKVLLTCLHARVVYIAGIATWPVTLAAIFCILFRRPFIISPRGGLMAGHVEEIKNKKLHKWIFYKLITIPSIERAEFIHVTSRLEQEGVMSLSDKAKCKIFVNGINLSEWPIVSRRKEKNITVCFVGRLNPDKGIRRFAKIWSAGRQPGDRLLIVGDGTGSYAEELRELARQAQGAIELLGNVDRRGVHHALARSHFLVLPSGIEGDNERENFGNVVAEALATGCPVLVSKRLAWDFAESAGIGFVFERTDDSIFRAIERARSLSDTDYLSMCELAETYAKENLQLKRTASNLWICLADR